MEATSIHIGAQSDMGESLLQVSPKKPKKANFSELIKEYLTSFQRIKIADKVTFFRLLATMINAGISIVKALQILEGQTEKRHMKVIIHEIALRIEAGESFSKALSAYSKYFSEAQIGMVEAGEASGQLNHTLLQIADQAEKEAAFRSRIKGAMIYPAVILSLMAIAFVVVMIVVMPQIKGMFESLGGELPTSTQALIQLSDFFVAKTLGFSNVYWVLIAVLAVIFGIVKMKQTKWGSSLWARFIFALPLFGRLSKKASLANFSRGLSTMVASGIPILKALQISSVSVGNPLYKKRIEQIAEDVKHGIAMAENMKDDPYYFPDMVVGMVGVGEQTAQMANITEKLADYYQEEVDDMVKGLSSLLEPVIMVVIGAAVAFLVIAVMEPILSASDLVV